MKTAGIALTITVWVAFGLIVWGRDLVELPARMRARRRRVAQAAAYRRRHATYRAGGRAS